MNTREQHEGPVVAPWLPRPSGRGPMKARPTAATGRREALRDPGGQAREILRLGYTAAPLLAGVDKFANTMVDWERYLNPRVSELLGVEPRTFMRAVGAIEIAAGLLVAARPKLGAWVVAGWLGGIIGNLVSQGRYWDIALRDLGLLLGAVALGRLEAGR